MKEIIVAVRKRPLLQKEKSRGDVDILKVSPPSEVIVRERRTKLDMSRYVEEHIFSFDAVFDEHCDNVQLYNKLLRARVAAAFGGAKISIFAYGQTGSGKTFTMLGNEESAVPGLYFLAAEDVFRLLGRSPDLCLAVSFYEIYCGKVFDLLNSREPCFVRVDARENVNVVGLSEKVIAGIDRLMVLIRVGLAARVTGANSANDESSRSHAVLCFALRDAPSGEARGRLSFVDLAGSERGADVGDAGKQTRADGAEINKSLLALKECIRALDRDKKYLPFRGSKLTMVLRDSFVGESVTVMIGNVAPNESACEHTLNTLRYADRVKQLRREQAPLAGPDRLAQQLMLPRRRQNSVRASFASQPIANADNRQSLHRSRQAEAPSRGASLGKLSRVAAVVAPLSITQLLSEQDKLVDEHSAHIDAIVACVKEEMSALEEARDSRGGITEYIARTKASLAKKMETILRFRERLQNFENRFQAFEANGEWAVESLILPSQRDTPD